MRLYHAKQLAPPAREAVAVLSRFAAAQTEQPVPKSATLDTPHILVLGEATPSVAASHAKRIKHDGYLVLPRAEGIALVATSPKGLLNAVYGYLAFCGVRWPKPGVELLPAPGKLPRPDKPLLRNPDYPGRGVFHSNHGDWPQWAEFYARLGFNNIGIHSSPTEWRDMLKVAERFGLELQIGGHGLSALLPRSEFEEHPEYFRALQPPDFDRRRMSDSNLCPGNNRALDIVRAGAKRYVRRFPGAMAYHLWADDLPAGGWCHCSHCMGLTPQDQAVVAGNAVAEGVCATDPSALTAHLIYHDTIEPPCLAKPHPRLSPLYAPRERCYGHALNDPACARNRYFARNLEAVLDWFDHREWLLFEYYSDYILFRGMLPVIPEVIAQDLRYYRSLGLNTAQHLFVGSGVGLQLNMHVHAALCWDLNSDPWEALRNLSRDVPGLIGAWRKQARASLRWLDISDWPISRYFDYRFLLEMPAKIAAPYRRGLLKAAQEMETAAASLPSELPAWAEGERWSLLSSAAICRQMEPQARLLQLLGEMLGGRDRLKEAKAAYRETLKQGTAIAKVFQQAGADKVYFFALERMMEQIWAEKMDTLRAPSFQC